MRRRQNWAVLPRAAPIPHKWSNGRITLMGLREADSSGYLFDILHGRRNYGQVQASLQKRRIADYIDGD